MQKKNYWQRQKSIVQYSSFIFSFFFMENFQLRVQEVNKIIEKDCWRFGVHSVVDLFRSIAVGIPTVSEIKVASIICSEYRDEVFYILDNNQYQICAK